MTQDQSNGTDKGTSAGGKPDLTVMDVMELMRHGGPDLVAEEVERRVRMGADPLHTVLGAKAHDKLIERAAKLRDECAPSSIVLMIEALHDEDAEWIPPSLRAAPKLHDGEQVLPKKMAEALRKAGVEGTGPAEGTRASVWGKTLGEATTRELLDALRFKGGTFKAVADAQLLVLKKSEDYNGGPENSRDVYFPFGTLSHAQMLHVKSQRINSLVNAERDGREVNFEGLKDTALDLINYASFLVEYLDREGNPF